MPNNPNMATPLSIIVAGFMIASAIFVSNTDTGFLNKNKTTPANANAGSQVAQEIDGGSDADAAADTGTVAEDEPAPSDTGPYKVTVGDDPVMGQAKAPVTIVEFLDFRCPFCQRFAEETLGKLKTDYVDTGKVKIVAKDLSIHPPQSQIAAEAAQCAFEQGKFWEYHDLLFKKLTAGDTFEAGTLKGYAKDLGLNQSTFDTCLDSGKNTAEVNGDYQEARTASATGTPTLFIGKTTDSGEIEAVKVIGAQPFETFAAEIDKLLK